MPQFSNAQHYKYNLVTSIHLYLHIFAFLYVCIYNTQFIQKQFLLCLVWWPRDLIHLQDTGWVYSCSVRAVGLSCTKFCFKNFEFKLKKFFFLVGWNITILLSLQYDITLSQGSYCKAKILIVIQCFISNQLCSKPFKYCSSQRLGRELLCHPGVSFQDFLISSQFILFPFLSVNRQVEFLTSKGWLRSFPFLWQAGIWPMCSDAPQGRVSYHKCGFRTLIESQKQ